MKRLYPMILALACLFCLQGCAEKEEPVIFYYPKAEVSFHNNTSIIAPETRESLSREDDLGYLLPFYLTGPVDPTLLRPVPEDTHVLQMIPYDGGMILVMSQEFSQLEGVDFTIACACISQTCFGLTDLQEITFAVGTEKNVLLTITRNSIVMTDTVVKTTE